MKRMGILAVVAMFAMFIGYGCGGGSGNPADLGCVACSVPGAVPLVNNSYANIGGVQYSLICGQKTITSTGLTSAHVVSNIQTCDGDLGVIDANVSGSLFDLGNVTLDNGTATFQGITYTVVPKQKMKVCPKSTDMQAIKGVWTTTPLNTDKGPVSFKMDESGCAG